MAGLRYLTDVATLTLDREKCTGCGMCVDVCPHAVVAVRDRKADVLDRDACMECGACARNCPAQAIQVRAGVGCAAAVINAMVTGGKPACDCAKGSSCCG